MRKNLLYLLLLLLVGLGIYFFIFKKQDNSFNKEETNFTLKDTASIGRIFFVRSNGQHIDLKRTKNGWMTNDSFPSRISTVNYLLSTFARQVARYPAPVQQKDNIIKSMAGNSVKVEIFNQTGDLMTAYYVGPDEETAHGTYLMNKGAQTIYFVQIPNYDGCLSAIYSTSLQDWRSRLVFDIAAPDIAEAGVQYFQQTQKSFTIHQQDQLTIDADATLKKGRTFNTSRAQSFLKFFTNVNCEGYLMNIPKMDSILSLMPHFCHIYVSDKSGKKSSIDIYLKPVNKRSKNINTIDSSAFDADRLYAVFNNYKDTGIIQYLSFEKLFRTAPEFFESDNVSAPKRK